MPSPPVEDPGLLQHSRRFFWLGCAVEAGLGGLAVMLFRLQGRSWDTVWSADARSVVLGLGATLPLLFFFHRTMTATAGPFVPVRRFLEQHLRPLMLPWSGSRVAVLALLAGLGEELLFRGVIQGWVGAHWGNAAGLLVASLLFGVAHSINGTYALTAGIMGGYLGLLLEVSGSLVCPIVTHALYDFLALLWLLRPNYRLLPASVAPEPPGPDTP